METIPQDHSDSDATHGVANLGVVRPPIVYGGSIVTGLLLQFGWPLPFLPPILAALLGIFLMAVAVLVFSYSIRTFQTSGTSVRGNKPTTVLVRTGPYRFSRNPIYLAFSVFQLGIASWVNSLWLIATFIAAVALMVSVVIPSAASDELIGNGRAKPLAFKHFSAAIVFPKGRPLGSKVG